MRLTLWVCSFLSLFFVSLAPAVADDRITLKVAGVLPANHYIVIQGAKFWMDRVTERTSGQVQFEYYPAEQLGKDVLALAQSGVVDIAEEPLAYVGDRLPLTGVVELPGMFETSCAGTNAYHAITEPGTPIAESDFKPASVQLLFAVTTAPYRLLTSRKAVRTVEDFGGLKLRTNGGGMELMARQLGGVSVRMAALDIYQSFSRGTLDGVFFSLQSVKPYDLQSVAKYVTTGFSFGSAVQAWLISDRTWSRLTPQVQKMMTEIGRQTEQNFCTYADANENREQKSLSDGGITLINLDAAQQDAVRQRVRPVAEQWAAELDKRGRPASQVLKDFETALKK